MDMGTVILIMTLIGGVIGIASYFGGRHSSAKKDGVEWGNLKSDIQYIKINIEDIKKSEERNATNLKESFDRVHNRIDDINKKVDEHIRDFHKKID